MREWLTIREAAEIFGLSMRYLHYLARGRPETDERNAKPPVLRKINFSQSGMTKKFNDPAATRSFVARHHCLSNKDKTSRSYWACRWPRFFSNSGKTWW